MITHHDQCTSLRELLAVAIAELKSARRRLVWQECELERLHALLERAHDENEELRTQIRYLSRQDGGHG